MIGGGSDDGHHHGTPLGGLADFDQFHPIRFFCERRPVLLELGVVAQKIIIAGRVLAEFWRCNVALCVEGGCRPPTVIIASSKSAQIRTFLCA